MSALQEGDDIKKELSVLSCPFTWQLQDASNYYVTTKKKITDIIDDDIDEEAYLYLEKLISCLTILYERVLFAEIDRANIKLAECEKLLMEMQDRQEDEDIMRVIEHIFNATKCHYFYEINNIEQVKIILITIVKTSDFNNMELAALSGCQSIAWSMFTDYGRLKAMHFARQALEQNSDKALWHFILAKSIRRERRLMNFYSLPSEEEKLNFALAYKKSLNPVFGMYLAQMYRECCSYIPLSQRKAQEEILVELYKEILQANGNNYKILLKLALGFTRINSSCQSLLANYCLDAVETMKPNHSTYFHYKGIYLEKFGDVKEALEFYKKGGDLHNYLADMDYIKCGWKAKLIDPLIHLQLMLEKYNGIHEERMQEIYLCIAICYYNKRELKQAMEHFLKSIEINPKSDKFKTKYMFLNFSTRNYNGGIYGFLNSEFLRIVKNCLEYRYKDEIFMRNYNKLNQLCKLYGKRFDTRPVSNAEE